MSHTLWMVPNPNLMVGTIRFLDIPLCSEFLFVSGIFAVCKVRDKSRGCRCMQMVDVGE